MNSVHGPVKLVAMADVVESRLTKAHKTLSNKFGDRVDVLGNVHGGDGREGAFAQAWRADDRVKLRQ